MGHGVQPAGHLVSHPASQLQAVPGSSPRAAAPPPKGETDCGLRAHSSHPFWPILGTLPLLPILVHKGTSMAEPGPLPPGGRESPG